MTPSQKRAMRAKQLLDSGKEAHEVAKELGYTKVSAMLGAISLCSRAIEREEKKVLEMIAQDPPKVVSKLVTEEGVRAELVFHTDEPVIDLLADGHADPVGEPGEPGEPGECEPTPAGGTSSALRAPSPEGKAKLSPAPAAKIYPVENRIIAIRRPHTWVSIKMDEMQVRINLTSNTGVNRWLALYGKHIGKETLVQTLREIAEAATEAAALIEEAGYVDHHK